MKTLHLIVGGKWHAWMGKPYYEPYCDLCGEHLVQGKRYTPSLSYYNTKYEVGGQCNLPLNDST